MSLSAVNFKREGVDFETGSSLLDCSLSVSQSERLVSTQCVPADSGSCLAGDFMVPGVLLTISSNFLSADGDILDLLPDQNKVATPPINFSQPNKPFYTERLPAVNHGHQQEM